MSQNPPVKINQQTTSFSLTRRNRRSATSPLGLRRGSFGTVSGNEAATDVRKVLEKISLKLEIRQSDIASRLVRITKYETRK